MAITLDNITLPSGLRWSDEYDWQYDTTTTEYSLTGALLVDRATKQKGRPITLSGGNNFAWLTKVELDAIRTLLETYPDTGLTLTLHDNRQFTVIPAAGALSVSPIPVVMDVGPAVTSNTTKYYLNSLKLMEI